MKSNIFAANYHRSVWIRAAGHRDSYASIRENCFRFFSVHPKLPDFVCNGPPTSPKVQDDIMMARYFELLRFGAQDVEVAFLDEFLENCRLPMLLLNNILNALMKLRNIVGRLNLRSISLCISAVLLQQSNLQYNLNSKQVAFKSSLYISSPFPEEFPQGDTASTDVYQMICTLHSYNESLFEAGNNFRQIPTCHFCKKNIDEQTGRFRN